MKKRSGGGYIRRRNAIGNFEGLWRYPDNTVHTESTRLDSEGGIVGKPLSISTVAEFELTGRQANLGNPITVASLGHRQLVFLPIVEITYQVNTCGIRPVESEFSPVTIDINHRTNPFDIKDLHNGRAWLAFGEPEQNADKHAVRYESDRSNRNLIKKMKLCEITAVSRTINYSGRKRLRAIVFLPDPSPVPSLACFNALAPDPASALTQPRLVTPFRSSDLL